MALVMASVKSATLSSETVLAGFGDGVGGFGDGVVGDGVGDIGDVVAGGGVGEVVVGLLIGTFRWHLGVGAVGDGVGAAVGWWWAEAVTR